MNNGIIRSVAAVAIAMCAASGWAAELNVTTNQRYVAGYQVQNGIAVPIMGNAQSGVVFRVESGVVAFSCGPSGGSYVHVNSSLGIVQTNVTAAQAVALNRFFSTMRPAPSAGAAAASAAPAGQGR